MADERNLNSKRMDDESYDEYKLRQRENTVWLKRRLKGYLYWNSASRGTYTREKAEELLKDDIQNDKISPTVSHKK